MTTTPSSEAKRVVILGSGYAGIYAYKSLIKQLSRHDAVEIVVISDTDHLLYQTMVYEVAAGNLTPSGIRQSVRILLSDRAHYIQGCATKVDLQNQTVHYTVPDAIADTPQDLQENVMSYDYLVDGIGSETNFFGTPGAREHAFTLKSLRNAIAIKNRVINQFEKAELTIDTKRRQELLTFVVVGGGPTGVTLSAKLADLINHELCDAYPELCEEAQIILLEGSDRLLSHGTQWFSDEAYETLTDKLVDVRLGERVNEVRVHGVRCKDKSLPSQTVIWTAGVKARELEFTPAHDIEREPHSNRIKVTNELHLETHENVFIGGDQAWVLEKESGQPYPMRAQFAVRQGTTAGNNIYCQMNDEPMEEFFWKDKGFVVSLGKGKTLADIFGYEFSGPLATVAYKMTYLLSTIGVRAKVRASIEWFLNLFLPRDISEL